MISRIAQNQLIEDMENFPAVAITGARQVGKTTLAQQVGQSLKGNFVYIDLEYPDDIAKVQNPVLFFKSHEKDCVILDEIHRKPELFPILRSIIDKNRRNGRFVILGSASPALLRESSESLAGRISYNILHPFCLPEVIEKTGWKDLFMRGGFPGSLFAKSVRSSMRWRTSFVQTYLERELPVLGLDSDVRILRKLLIMLAQSQAGTLNTQTLANSLGVTRPTVARYIDFMEKAYLLFKIEPYYANIKKRLVKSPKIYLCDSGIFLSLLGIQTFDSLITHPSVGACWEGFVIQQTRAVLPPDFDIWFFRTHEGAEADIVITNNEQTVLCAEIKWTNAPKLSKGFRNVISYLDSPDNYIITPEADTYPVENHISVTNLTNWIKIVRNLND